MRVVFSKQTSVQNIQPYPFQSRPSSTSVSISAADPTRPILPTNSKMSSSQSKGKQPMPPPQKPSVDKIIESQKAKQKMDNKVAKVVAKSDADDHLEKLAREQQRR
ncbi:hypothetical protein MGN70_000318 [Eutypa lata]|nr:hypothetical protein MGN70_000318 [Eutypa lata]